MDFFTDTLGYQYCFDVTVGQTGKIHGSSVPAHENAQGFRPQLIDAVDHHVHLPDGLDDFSITVHRIANIYKDHFIGIFFENLLHFLFRDTAVSFVVHYHQQAAAVTQLVPYDAAVQHGRQKVFPQYCDTHIRFYPARYAVKGAALLQRRQQVADVFIKVAVKVHRIFKDDGMTFDNQLAIVKVYLFY